MSGMHQSIGGNICLNVFGFRSETNSSCPLNKPLNRLLDSLQVESVLFPERLLIGTAINAKDYNTASLRTIWNKSNSFPFSYSVMQRKVSFISFKISETSNPKDKTTKRFNTLGTASIDVSGLVFKSLQSISHVPVYKENNTLSSSALTATDDGLPPSILNQELIGWLLIGVCVNGDLKELEAQCSNIWKYSSNALSSSSSSSPSTLCMVTSPLASIASSMDLTSLFSSGRIVVSCASLLSQSLIQLPSTPLQDTKSSAAQQVSRTSLCLSHEAWTPVLTIYLLLDSTLIAKASLTLPFEWLKMGKPIDLNVPLRSIQGDRICTLPLILQISSLASSGPSSFPSFSSLETKFIPTNRSMKEVRMNLSDIHVFDPSWANEMRLYLEYGLTFFFPNNYHKEPITICGSSTFEAFNAPNKEAFFSFPLSFEDELQENATSALLTIVCRDVNRLNAPEIVRGKLDILDSLVHEGVSKPMILNPVEKLVEGEVGKSGRLFNLRAEVKSSCVVTFQSSPLPSSSFPSSFPPLTNTATLTSLTSSSSFTNPLKNNKSAIAKVKVYIYAIVSRPLSQQPNQSWSSSSRLSDPIRKLKLTSSLETNPFQKPSSSCQSPSFHLVGAVGIVGSEGNIVLEAELRSGLILTGNLLVSNICTIHYYILISNW